MVLIKDMEKPKSCNVCRLRDMHYGECNVTHKRIKAFDSSASLPPWCPLIEVDEREEKNNGSGQGI